MCPQHCVLVCQGLKTPSSLLADILVTNPVQQAPVVVRLVSAISTDKSRSNRQVLIERLKLLHTVIHSEQLLPGNRLNANISVEVQ